MILAMRHGGPIPDRLAEATSIPEVFELVKEAVSRCTGRQRAGLMLGMADLASGREGFVGAFYPIDTNIIVMNRLPLAKLRATEPELLNPYVFHILLHEYLHSLGVVDEHETMSLALRVSSEVFGPRHPVTALAEDLSRFLPKLVHPFAVDRGDEDPSIELVDGFDLSSTEHYIW